MLTIVGGTYLEECYEPPHFELLGSGLRAAIALSDLHSNISFHSCVAQPELQKAIALCKLYNINYSFSSIHQTVTFSYHHPLSPPLYTPHNIDSTPINVSDVEANTILYYGLIEANIKVIGDYVVYDPQNAVSLRNTDSQARHLALVLNKNEALSLNTLSGIEDLADIGKGLLKSEGAEVVIIKNGSKGALVVDENGHSVVPVYETKSVFSIGSGDIFSAVFAWQWMIEKADPVIAANIASKYTAYYCQTKNIPLSKDIPDYKSLSIKAKNKVYLAGPFFTIAERWLINELQRSLVEFENDVFSPYHDIDQNMPVDEIAKKDLEEIQKADVVLAVASGLDAGTLFEIGYAKALNKRVIVLAENMSDEDVFMIKGSNCEVTEDFTTAVYKASW